MLLPDMRGALLEPGCEQVYHGPTPIPPATAMIAKTKTPAKPPPPPNQPKPVMQPASPVATPASRWLRTQRYGWDKGGSRGGRR
jgi:hypothetical protein